jgi:hypothetical protein
MSFAISAVLAATIGASSAATGPSNCDRDLGTWLDCNNPRVMKYLQHLGASDVGHVLTGVSLTDGQTVLRGMKYIGQATGLGRGVHLYLFERRGERSAFLWIDADGDTLRLPSCPASVSAESSYVLSGDVHTARTAEPGHGVIEVKCVKESWMQRVAKPNPTMETDAKRARGSSP